MLSSGAQHPLRHWSFVAQRAAHDVPVTVDWTQTALAQHGCPVCVLQSPPGVAHEPAQYNAGAQTAAEPSMSTLQQPLVHCESLRHVAAQTAFAVSFVSKTHVLPLQHAFVLPRQLPPGVVQAAPLGASALPLPSTGSPPPSLPPASVIELGASTELLLQPPATTAPATAITIINFLIGIALPHEGYFTVTRAQ